MKTQVKYRLQCLICHHHEGSSLVGMQEHAMQEHGYTQYDMQRTTKQQIPNGYIFTFPDGTDWLKATHPDIASEET